MGNSWAYADAWLPVYAILLGLTLLTHAALGLFALLARDAPRPFRNASGAICIVQLLVVALTPVALALRAEQVASRFGVENSWSTAIAWCAPVLSLGCVGSSLVALVLSGMLHRCRPTNSNDSDG